MAISNSQITKTTSSVYTASGQQAITTAIFCNVSDTTATSVDVYAVPFGQSAGVRTQIMKGIALPPGETFVLDTERLILEDQDALFARAEDNNVVTVTVSTLSTQ